MCRTCGVLLSFESLLRLESRLIFTWARLVKLMGPVRDFQSGVLGNGADYYSFDIDSGMVPSFSDICSPSNYDELSSLEKVLFTGCGASISATDRLVSMSESTN